MTSRRHRQLGDVTRRLSSKPAQRPVLSHAGASATHSVLPPTLASASRQPKERPITSCARRWFRRRDRDAQDYRELLGTIRRRDLVRSAPIPTRLWKRGERLVSLRGRDRPPLWVARRPGLLYPASPHGRSTITSLAPSVPPKTRGQGAALDLCWRSGIRCGQISPGRAAFWHRRLFVNRRHPTPPRGAPARPNNARRRVLRNILRGGTNLGFPRRPSPARVGHPKIHNPTTPAREPTTNPKATPYHGEKPHSGRQRPTKFHSTPRRRGATSTTTAGVRPEPENSKGNKRSDLLGK